MARTPKNAIARPKGIKIARDPIVPKVKAIIPQGKSVIPQGNAIPQMPMQSPQQGMKPGGPDAGVFPTKIPRQFKNKKS